VKWYAVLFALITIASTGFLLPGVQSNAISSSMHNAFEIPVAYTGIGVVVLLAVIIFGGVQRIGRVAELVVPFMAGAYILMALVIIALNYTQILDVFGLIFSSAFSLNATFGGVVGMAIAWGVKRGIYSNEAGQGTAPHAAAAADVSHPAQQGLVQAFSVYVDTIFVCTATGLMILFTNQYNVGQFDGAGQLMGFISEHIPGVNYTAFTQAAVSHHFPLIGNGFVAIALFFFAFTTVMAYYYYAETNLSYIFSNKVNPTITWVLRLVFLGAVYYGSVKTAEIAWAIGDIGVGLMAYVNLIAILLMSKTALKVWKDYKMKRNRGELNPKFSARELGIKNADFWDQEKL